MDRPQPKKFNTTGVCVPSKHYMLPVLPRIPAIDDMVEGEFYFILHAPRQSGKTTYIEALTNKINSDGQYYAFDCSLDGLRFTTDVEKGISSIVALINTAVKTSDVPVLKSLGYPDDGIPKSDPSVKLFNMLNYLSAELDKELAVFFDEADCLTGQVLIPFLSQIRNGYLRRHGSVSTKFPRSMALIGMRDIRDYLVRVRPEDQAVGLASPFNVKKESLTLANFTQAEIQTLYCQHTEATGQVFTQDAIERAWYWSEGQPWLVNAIAGEIVVKQLRNDFSTVISESNIDQAA